ncbi:MAG: hypothetical protein HRF49_05335 [bacterium]
MRTLTLAVLFVVAMAGGAIAAGLTVDDFYPAMPSRTMIDYREALLQYPSQRFQLVHDKEMGYTVYGYLFTREMVKDFIQAVIDEYGLNDPGDIQWLIDKYAYYTPEPGQVLVFAYFEGFHMENRYYKELLDTWPETVYFEFGVDQIQRIIERQRKNVEHYRGEPEEGDNQYGGGINPITFHYTDDWIWAIKPEYSFEYRRVPNAYEYRFEFWFTDSDIQLVKDLIENEIFPTFRLVSSQYNLYGKRTFDRRFGNWIIKSLDPEYFDMVMEQQRKKLWTGAKLSDPNRY